MFHQTTMTDERIRDLQATAAELRLARSVHPRRGWFESLRLRTGSVLLAAGEALVSGARPVMAGRATRPVAPRRATR